MNEARIVLKGNRNTTYKNVFAKPHHFDMNVKLGWYDKLCVSKQNAPCKCLEVHQWYKRDPLAVMVDNVVNQGAMLRKEVYLKFAKKLAGVKFSKEREVLRNMVSLKPSESKTKLSEDSN